MGELKSARDPSAAGERTWNTTGGSEVNQKNPSPSLPAANPGVDAEQFDPDGENIGVRKWSKLQTVVFVTAASAALWCAIGYGIFRLLSR